MNILKQLRSQKNILQRDVADYLGVDRTTYVRYENGDCSLNPDMLIKLSDYYGVSVDYILGKTNIPQPLNEKLEGVEFALYGEIHDLTEEEKQDILSYVKFKKSQRGDNV